MQLTALGAQVATMGEPEKKKHAKKLINGVTNINSYTTGVCYDTVAYVKYLLGAKRITPNFLKNKKGGDWNGVFDFRHGRKWDGKKIEPGKAVGFYRLNDSKIFHAALATGGTKIRAVNGFKLGPGWKHEVDLKKILGEPNENMVFNYDNAKIEVWVSKL